VAQGDARLASPS